METIIGLIGVTFFFAAWIFAASSAFRNRTLIYRWLKDPSFPHYEVVTRKIFLKTKIKEVGQAVSSNPAKRRNK